MRSSRRRSKPRPRFIKGQQFLRWTGFIVLGFFLLSLLFHFFIALPLNQKKPIDGVLVLGGGVEREVYAAQLAKKFPDVPIVISGGTIPPCSYQVFQREKAPMNRVWLELCAQSTFDNFLFSIPIFKKWNVHRVRLITSPTHLPRAKWLADILLGSQGIAVEVDIEIESVLFGAIVGSTESDIKSFLDVSRSLLFAVVGQVWNFSCGAVFPLKEMGIESPLFKRENLSC